MDGIKKIIDIVVPRFVTEYVAFVEEEDGIYPLCAAFDITPDDRPSYAGKMKSFNLLGVGFFPRLIGDLEPWDEYERRA